jgi:hypothetical protein
MFYTNLFNRLGTPVPLSIVVLSARPLGRTFGGRPRPLHYWSPVA